MAADRIKRLQGKGAPEKSLDFWSEQKKEKDETEEKEALINKYVTIPKTSPVNQNKSSGMSKGKLSLLVFVLAFFIGTGYGVYVMTMAANESTGIYMTVNESAFPVLNNTNTTNTTISKNTTKKPAKNNTTNSTTPPKNSTD
ncbi:MAG: hypothetical protein PHY59_00155 [Methanobacterium sp.]|nr:hypothetical protein [Methanobacterium sp.]